MNNKKQESTKKTIARLLAAILALLMCGSVIAVAVSYASCNLANTDAHASVTAIPEYALTGEEIESVVYTEVL